MVECRIKYIIYVPDFVYYNMFLFTSKISFFFSAHLSSAGQEYCIVRKWPAVNLLIAR